MAGVATRRLLDPTPNEHLVHGTPLAFKGDGTKPAVIYCHGGGGTELEGFDPNYGKAIRACAVAGYPTVCANLGGPLTYGNDTAITRVGQARTWAQANGAKSGKVFVLGQSMGFLAACNWARQNPTLTAGVIGTIPAVGLQFMHDSIAGAAAEIDVAYGTHDGYLAALSTHDPAAYGPTELAGVAMLLAYSTDETQGASAAQANFVAAMQAVNPAVTAVTMTGGHSLANLDTGVFKPFLDRNAT